MAYPEKRFEIMLYKYVGSMFVSDEEVATDCVQQLERTAFFVKKVDHATPDTEAK